MKKTYLQVEIEKARKVLYKHSQTSWYDSGVRDVLTEGYLKGLEKAQRLIRKQAKLNELSEKEQGNGV